MTARIILITPALKMAVWAWSPKNLPATGDKNAPKFDSTKAMEVKNGAFYALEISLILLKIYGIVNDPAIPDIHAIT